jgi:hypothetical protein
MGDSPSCFRQRLPACGHRTLAAPPGPQRPAPGTCARTAPAPGGPCAPLAEDAAGTGMPCTLVLGPPAAPPEAGPVHRAQRLRRSGWDDQHTPAGALRCRLAAAPLAWCGGFFFRPQGAQRWRSPAAGSGSDAGADAGGSQVQCFVRPHSEPLPGLHPPCCLSAPLGRNGSCTTVIDYAYERSTSRPRKLRAHQSWRASGVSGRPAASHASRPPRYQ